MAAMRQSFPCRDSVRVVECVIAAVLSTFDSQLFSLRLCAFAGNILGEVDLPQRRKGAKKDQSFCHCVTTKHDVSFVWSLLIHGSSFISSGANNFLLLGGMRNINEFKTSKNAMLPR